MTDQNRAVPPLTGYLDRLSARPGERICVKTSAEAAGEVAARVVRIWNADANPAGMGIQTEAVPGLDLGTYPGRRQVAQMGSWGWVPLGNVLDAPKVHLSFGFQPWLLGEDGGTLLALDTGWTLTARTDGLELANWRESITLAIPLKRRVWYRVALSFDLRAATVAMSAASSDGLQAAETSGALIWAPQAATRLCFAAAPGPGGMSGHLNGRMEDIVIRAHAADGPILANWDFTKGMQGVSVIDSGPHGLHGQLVNLPARAMRGSRWTGEEMAWPHARSQYSAIHFHEDDLHDCGWSTDLELTIPDDMASGVYGVELTQGEVTDTIPFYVLPPRGRTTAKVCYLASTFTYMAYANHARDNLDEAMEARIAEWGTPRGPDSYPGFGFSTYNFHPDGSGHCLSSRLRPILTMRPGFLTFAIHEGSGLRHFPADGHLVEWFRQKDIPVDVITDEDLHREGLGLIAEYDCLVTGSHPEYHTPATLDALRDYSRQGGNFCYLGGNGFYWKIAVNDNLPGVMEIRRAEGGIRAWAADAGEAHNMLDGQYGGMWRRNGRAPQQVGAVGFSSQGLFEGSGYRLTETARDPAYAWIFDGVSEDPLGDYGFSGGGAAGFELDRADFELGTPEGTVVLARSFDHGPNFVCVPEELLSHLRTVTGEPPRDLVRAEIVYAEMPGGGHIFATGSITFCGSLPWNGFDNGCARMLENVVRRFIGG
ncbi:N,N-dimethylformamidase beta subunit family domain-containing protein [Pseudooceanicola pacificus]|uniref:N,N-dimethylformamidase beta subunit family domain-containing protein n=1 Tax=Pseudooceanicola pacificus TaxID=2676438 RepID=UPI001924A92B|nr:N,N-dimethylformamidase beta subunit family domain-containing protein [Pseudooceanicola pacificus]